MNKINVEVTEDDIRLAIGKIPICENCPVARAISRATGKRIIVNGRKWAIYGDYKDIKTSNAWTWHDLPGIAINFIVQFDRHSRRVNPINFEIELE